DAIVDRLVRQLALVGVPPLGELVCVGRDDRVGQDAAEVEVLDVHEVEAAEPLVALQRLVDPEAGGLEDVRVVPERRVVVLADPVAVDVRVVRLLDVVRDQRQLSHPQISSANDALMWSAGRSGSGSQAWWKRRAFAATTGSPRMFSTQPSGSRT